MFEIGEPKFYIAIQYNISAVHGMLGDFSSIIAQSPQFSPCLFFLWSNFNKCRFVWGRQLRLHLVAIFPYTVHAHHCCATWVQCNTLFLAYKDHLVNLQSQENEILHTFSSLLVAVLMYLFLVTVKILVFLIFKKRSNFSLCSLIRLIRPCKPSSVSAGGLRNRCFNYYY